MKRLFAYCAIVLLAAVVVSCSKSEKGGTGHESYALIVTLTKNTISIPKDAGGHSTNPELERLYNDISTDMSKFFSTKSSKWIVEFNTKNGEKELEAKDEDAKKKMESLVAEYNAWLEKNYAASLKDHATYGTGSFSIEYTAVLERSQKKNIVSPQVLKASYSN